MSDSDLETTEGSEGIEEPGLAQENVVSVVDEIRQGTGPEAKLIQFIPGNDYFNRLISDFLEYSEEVNLNRAIPDVRDGLKPSQRRALLSTFSAQGTKIEKSATAVGETMKSHPHGDASIYQTIVNLTDRKGLALIPLFAGDGAFGHQFSPEPAASPRYTEVAVHPNAKSIFFSEKEELQWGVSWKQSEAKITEVEPVVLPARFPYVLCSESMGIGVSIQSNLPSFNPNEVLEMTKKYIRTKGFTDFLYPDFGTYGTVVIDVKQAKKLLTGEKARMVTRSNVKIMDDVIRVYDTPKNRNFQTIMREANKRIEDKFDAGFDAIEIVTESSDFSGPKVDVYPKKGKIEKAYRQLLASGLLTRAFTTSMYMVYETEEGKVSLIQPGVYETIQIWYKFRVEVLRKTFRHRVEVYEERMDRLSYLLDLSRDEEAVKEFLSLLRTASREEYESFLHTFFSDRGITEEMVKWLTQRRVVDFRKASVYSDEYDSLKAEHADLVRCIESDDAIDEYILEDLDSLETELGVFPRRTEISNTIYVKPEEVKTEAEGVFLLDEQGNLSFVGKKPRSGQFALEMHASSNEILVLMDTMGRVARFRGDQLKNSVNVKKEKIVLSGHSELLTAFLAPEDDEFRKPLVFFNDGYYGTLDTTSWYGLKKLTNRVNTDRAHYDEISQIFFDEPDIDTCYLTFEQRGDKTYAAYVRASDLPTMEFGRRRKVFDRSKNIGAVVEVPESTLEELFEDDLENYRGVLTRVKFSDEEKVQHFVSLF